MRLHILDDAAKAPGSTMPLWLEVVRAANAYQTNRGGEQLFGEPLAILRKGVLPPYIEVEVYAKAVVGFTRNGVWLVGLTEEATSVLGIVGRVFVERFGSLVQIDTDESY